MADNVTIYNGPLATFQLATEDVAGIHHEKLLMEWGASPVVVDTGDPLPSQILSMPAVEDTIDSIASADFLSYIIADVGGTLTRFTPKHGVISVTASGDNQVITAVASKVIYVMQWMFTCVGADSYQFQDDAGTNLTGVMPFAANGGAVAGYSKMGWFKTGVGQGVDLNIVGGADAGGVIGWVEVG